jgi:hypothetical protein
MASPVGDETKEVPPEGKTVGRNVPPAPLQYDGLEYEIDAVGGATISISTVSGTLHAPVGLKVYGVIPMVVVFIKAGTQVPVNPLGSAGRAGLDPWQ